jgi:hypothetical protein
MIGALWSDQKKFKKKGGGAERERDRERERAGGGWGERESKSRLPSQMLQRLVAISVFLFVLSRRCFCFFLGDDHRGDSALW